MINSNNSPSDRVFNFLVHSLLIFMLIIVAYPLYFVIIASISNPDMVNSGKVLFLPKGVSIDGYKLIFNDSRIWTGYRNTIFYCTGFTAISVTLSLLTGYSLSKRDLVGRRVINLFFVLTMYFNGGLIPTYLLVKSLNLINKPYTLWILGALSIFNVIIARTNFETSIPSELNDAASIDGCNQAQFFVRVVLPLSKPLISVLALYAIVSQWNSYFNAMIYLNETKYNPLQLVLRDILIANKTLQDSVANINDVKAQYERENLAQMIQYGVIIVASAPLLIIYPFIQRYFVQGIMIGSVKG